MVIHMTMKHEHSNNYCTLPLTSLSQQWRINNQPVNIAEDSADADAAVGAAETEAVATVVVAVVAVVAAAARTRRRSGCP